MHLLLRNFVSVRTFTHSIFDTVNTVLCHLWSHIVRALLGLLLPLHVTSVSQCQSSDFAPVNQKKNNCNLFMVDFLILEEPAVNLALLQCTVSTRDSSETPEEIVFVAVCVCAYLHVCALLFTVISNLYLNTVTVLESHLFVS